MVEKINSSWFKSLSCPIFHSHIIQDFKANVLMCWRIIFTLIVARQDFSSQSVRLAAIHYQLVVPHTNTGGTTHKNRWYHIQTQVVPHTNTGGTTYKHRWYHIQTQVVPHTNTGGTTYKHTTTTQKSLLNVSLSSNMNSIVPRVTQTVTWIAKLSPILAKVDWFDINFSCYLPTLHCS